MFGRTKGSWNSGEGTTLDVGMWSCGATFCSVGRWVVRAEQGPHYRDGGGRERRNKVSQARQETARTKAAS